MRVFLDITRLATRVLRSSPSGIDRVEHAYARHLLALPDTLGVFTAPIVAGAVSRARALDILARVDRAWRLDAPAETDAQYLALRGWLDRPLDPNARGPARFREERRWTAALTEIDLSVLRDIVRAETRLNRWVARNAGEPAMYFHASHAQLHKPERFAWLGRADLRATFFIHDAIPIDYPEFCSPGSLGRHVQRLMTVSAHAALAIVNSDYSRRRVARALEDRHARVPEIEVVPLAVGEAFLAERSGKPARPERPYFLCVGNIEPRKNILFLLEVWRRLVEKHGPRAPRLVIAGRRGWENENIVDVLERSRALAPYLAEVSDLTDAGVARLMAQATALLSPSSIEGFGLPIAEALAVGAPVVASDIDAHREVGGEYAVFVDALDGPGWLAAIEALMETGSEWRRAREDGIARYAPLTWEGHVRAARDLMQRAARSV